MAQKGSFDRQYELIKLKAQSQYLDSQMKAQMRAQSEYFNTLISFLEQNDDAQHPLEFESIVQRTNNEPQRQEVTVNSGRTRKDDAVLAPQQVVTKPQIQTFNATPIVEQGTWNGTKPTPTNGQSKEEWRDELSPHELSPPGDIPHEVGFVEDNFGQVTQSKA